jgi:Ni,Fe-hydrogenase III large subunit
MIGWEEGTLGEQVEYVEPAVFADAIAEAVEESGSLAGLFFFGDADGQVELRAVLADGGDLRQLVAVLPPTSRRYPAVGRLVEAAVRYERLATERFGIEPEGLPPQRLLARPILRDGERRSAPVPGLFALPYGPVRSGVFESVEWVLSTRGEEILGLFPEVRPKRRGIEQAFEGRSPEEAVVVAERVEGTACIAEALAMAGALERLSGIEVPRPAALARLVHAELERIATHLSSMVRHCEGAGQAVAQARLATHRETVLRLRAALCGHRFGRGVVVPGGVTGPPMASPRDVQKTLERLEDALSADLDLLMTTPSFLDRLRGTGLLHLDEVVTLGALGPVARGSGVSDDVRHNRPTKCYEELGFRPAVASEGDALARQQVRVEEVRESFRLLRAVLAELADGSGWQWATRPWRVPLSPRDGTALGWAESPQGEVLTMVEVQGGRVRRAAPRPASFHNVDLFPAAFKGDIFTDFVFIEASFGLSIAGAAG